jgi:hypothetical protein
MSMRTTNSSAITEYSADRAAWQVKEFCRAYRISNSTFWKYVKLDLIKIIRVGGRVLVPQEEARRIATEGLRLQHKPTATRRGMRAAADQVVA